VSLNYCSSPRGERKRTRQGGGKGHPIRVCEKGEGKKDHRIGGGSLISELELVKFSDQMVGTELGTKMRDLADSWPDKEKGMCLTCTIIGWGRRVVGHQTLSADGRGPLGPAWGLGGSIERPNLNQMRTLRSKKLWATRQAKRSRPLKVVVERHIRAIGLNWHA